MSDAPKATNLPVFFSAAAILVGGILLSLFVGAAGTPVFEPQIFWLLRVPRTLSAIAVGGGLAVAGALVQASLGNPLAEPYTIGVASAAALGAVIGSVGGSFFTQPQTSAGLVSALWGSHPLLGTGGLAFMFAMLGLSSLSFWLKRSFRHAVEVLLVGVVASFFFSALSTLIMALADPSSWPSAVTWILGSLGRLSLAESAGALLIMAMIVTAAWFHWKPLDLISVDPLSAESAGVDVAAFRKRIFVLVSLITAVSVAVAGVIGFVGLLVPHLLRRLGTRSHLTLVPFSFLLGAGFLLSSDVLARVVARPSELPVGVILALIGAPFFLALARNKALQ